MAPQHHMQWVEASGYCDGVTALPVTDLEAAATWHTTHFGMTEVSRTHTTVTLTRNGVCLGFQLIESLNSSTAANVSACAPENDGAAIKVTDARAARAELEAAGVVVSNWRVSQFGLILEDHAHTQCFTSFLHDVRMYKYLPNGWWPAGSHTSHSLTRYIPQSHPTTHSSTQPALTSASLRIHSPTHLPNIVHCMSPLTDRPTDSPQAHAMQHCRTGRHSGRQRDPSVLRKGARGAVLLLSPTAQADPWSERIPHHATGTC
jgi:catechol 2,3-dioxygenase-like lactoylglutathione lyase family enzyme